MDNLRLVPLGAILAISAVVVLSGILLYRALRYTVTKVHRWTIADRWLLPGAIVLAAVILALAPAIRRMAVALLWPVTSYLP